MVFVAVVTVGAVTGGMYKDKTKGIGSDHVIRKPVPFVLSLYMYPESADSEGSGAGMAADAHSQRCFRQVQIREITAHLRLEDVYKRQD